MVRPAEEVATALELARGGLSSSEIARRTGIPRRTVADWRGGSCPRIRKAVDFGALPAAPYAYVLGLYLGDGCISRCGRTQRLRITLDTAYPGIIAACCSAVAEVMPNRAVSRVQRKERAVDVSCYALAWLELLPQHGAGPKHERPIVLRDWQEAIVRAEPCSFIKGLFDSDGSYVLNHVRSASGHAYSYDRYFFTNTSSDIRALFIWACRLIGVDARPAGIRNVSVARRDSVAILNEFLGPKR
jgi:hypothetical protein